MMKRQYGSCFFTPTSHYLDQWHHMVSLGHKGLLMTNTDQTSLFGSSGESWWYCKYSVPWYQENTASMASREQNFGMFDDNTDANSADNPVIRDGTGLLTSLFSPLKYLSNRALAATSTKGCFVLSSRWWLSWHVSHIQAFWQFSQEMWTQLWPGKPKVRHQ